MHNIINDLSTLTTLPVSGIKDIISIINDCISHEVLEAKLSDKDIATINFGDMGKLLIKISDENLSYKFIPSSALEKLLISTLNNNSSELENKIESVLTKRVITAYKDLL